MTFTLIFLGMLSLSVATEAWLALRQVRHVRSHRGAVPAAFRDRVDLAAHRKAADYTVARTRFGLVGLALAPVVLRGWTLGGGLAAMQGLWQQFAGPGLAAGV